MDADRIPIADLQPGDQFRLSHVLPVVTVQLIGPRPDGLRNGIAIVTREGPKVFSRPDKLVHLVQRTSERQAHETS